MGSTGMREVYERRASRHWTSALYRFLEPPLPLLMNPREPKDYPLGRWNLYIGGAAPWFRDT